MNRSRILIIVLLVGLGTAVLGALLLTPEQESTETREETVGTLDEYFDNLVETKQISGAVNIVVHEGEVIERSVYGYQDMENRVPMGLDTIFALQSMTKPLVSAGLMVLYDEGRFELDDLVSKYLPQFERMKLIEQDDNRGTRPQFADRESTITIKHILTHTAGLLHEKSERELAELFFETLYITPHRTLEERVSALATLPLTEEPGSARHYGPATDIVALLIERLSGMTAAEFLKQRIFKPLKMDDTGYNIPDEKADRVAKVYVGEVGGRVRLAEYQPRASGNTVFGGTHGIFSTAADYLNFVLMIRNGGVFEGNRILKEETVELMLRDHVKGLMEENTGFGLGFGLNHQPSENGSPVSGTEVWWGGAFCTFFFISPTYDLVSVLMMHRSPYTTLYSGTHKRILYNRMNKP